MLELPPILNMYQNIHPANVLKEILHTIDRLPFRSHFPFVHQNNWFSLLDGILGFSFVHTFPDINRIHLVNDVFHLVLRINENL